MAATATPKIPDEISIIILQQDKHVSPGKYTFNIGFAHEYIVRGVAKVCPESEADYKAFAASTKRRQDQEQDARDKFNREQEAKSKTQVAREGVTGLRGLGGNVR